MVDPLLESEFALAAAELVHRQQELLPRVAEALKADPYEYWILRRLGQHVRKASRPKQKGITADKRWRWFFHGLELDIVNVADGRLVRVDFGPGGRPGVFTAWGVGQLVCSAEPPWRVFPELRDYLGGPGTFPEFSRLKELERALWHRGLIAYAAPDLVRLREQHTKRDPGGSSVIDMPSHLLPPEPSDLYTCDRLVLTDRAASIQTPI